MCKVNKGKVITMMKRGIFEGVESLPIHGIEFGYKRVAYVMREK